MNIFSLSLAAIRQRPLHSLLCVSAIASGMTLLCAVFLMSHAIENGFMRNARGIDIVIGAKGSPLQLILSSVYHADAPTGNIENEDVEKILHTRQVKSIIPLALGDNFKGWRIVGTTPEYLALYHATLANGSIFTNDFDAVAGSLTQLKTGDEFLGAHGLSADSDDIHHFHPYKITGVMKPTGTVLDRLILTSVHSVQELHNHPDAGDDDAAEDLRIAHEVTALLVKVKSPVAIMNLPREINRNTNMQAASPGYEIARLSQNLGTGRDVLNGLGIGFIALAALMLLSVLASGLAARRYDLAVLRVLGASPFVLAGTVVFEALILSLAGSALGITCAHLISFALATYIGGFQGVLLPQEFLVFNSSDAVFLIIGMATGLVAALVPAIAAARSDIAGLLAQGRA